MRADEDGRQCIVASRPCEYVAERIFAHSKTCTLHLANEIRAHRHISIAERKARIASLVFAELGKLVHHFFYSMFQ